MGRSGGGGGGFGGGGFGGGSFGGGRSGGSFGSAGRSGGGFNAGGFGGTSRGKSTGTPFGGGAYGGFGFPFYRQPMIYVNNSRRYGGGPSGGPPNQSPKKSSGILKTALFLIIAVVIIVLFVSLFSGSGTTKSTVERTPLANGSVIETAYFTDEPGWISNQSELISGLRSFYQKTGIQPYVYIAQSIPNTSNPTGADMQEYAEKLYGDLIKDEGHFLLVFYDYGNGNYICGYWQGAQTRTIMDSEAISILSDYIAQFYYSDLTEEQFFAKSFSKTADRIMTVTKSPIPTIFISLIVFAIVLIAFSWWKKAKEQEARRAKETQDILNTPLEKFGDTTVDDLAKKYEDTEL